MLIRTLLLTSLGALLTAATCVTSFEQQSPSGPWTGEFVNLADYTIGAPAYEITIRNANGLQKASTMTVCPGTVEAGESAAFKISAINAAGATTVLPLTAEGLKLIPGSPAYAYPTEQPGLHANIGTDPPQPSVRLGVVYNQSTTETYFLPQVCAVARDADGEVVDVSTTYVPGPIDPNENVDVEFHFSSLDRARSIDVITRAYAANVVDTEPHGGRVADLGPFNVLLPQGWAYSKQQGIDSFVGAIVSETNALLQFDYGWYSGSLEYIPGTSEKFADDPNYVVLEERIDGYDATIVYPRPGLTGITGVYVENIKRQSNINAQTDLLMTGDNIPPDLLDDALAIFRSLEFEEQ